nr:hypothetical protein CFP56_62467 [Quercus suber]
MPEGCYLQVLAVNTIDSTFKRRDGSRVPLLSLLHPGGSLPAVQPLTSVRPNISRSVFAGRRSKAPSIPRAAMVIHVAENRHVCIPFPLAACRVG